MKLDRSLYKEIKKMNRAAMQEFLERLYRSGYEDGTEISSNADFRIRLHQILENTKGVGITLYQRIMKTEKEMKE